MNSLFAYLLLPFLLAGITSAPCLAVAAEREVVAESAVLGRISRDSLDFWTGKAIAIPFYNNETIKVEYAFSPEDDPAFLAEADKALSAFLKRDDTYRLSLSGRVGEFAKVNLTAWDYSGYEARDEEAWVGLRDMNIDAAWLDAFVAGAKRPEEVWGMVGNMSEIYVARDTGGDDRIYVAVTWNCLWDVEHGFMLTFRDGAELARVGASDGELAD